jgi:hypothetical protein
VNFHDEDPQNLDSASSTPSSREIPTYLSVDDRVVDTARFGPYGTVVGICGPWVWVLWDEYVAEQHQPSTYHHSVLRRKLGTQ